jgi:hypothetical protein
MKVFTSIKLIVLACLIVVAIIAGCSDDPTSVGSPPQKPSNPIPTDGELGVDRVLTVRWDCSDPDGDELQYKVEIYLGSNLEFSAAGLNTKSWQIPDTLLAETQYTWRVIATEKSDGQLTAVSPNWTFTTRPWANSPPTTPSNPSPGDGAVGRSINADLFWTSTDPDAGDTLTYNVKFSAYTPPSLVSAGQLEASYDLPTLDYETVYYWQVIAYDEYGDSTVGPQWSFTTENLPGGEGVFASLTVERNITWTTQVFVRRDALIARFDSAYAPTDTIEPLRAAGVSVNQGQYQLPWVSNIATFQYVPATQFLTLGASYEFDVEDGGGVPALTEGIDMLGCEPYITHPTQGGGGPVTGFTCSWEDYLCGGTVRLIILGIMSEPTGVDIVTTNDGSYTFTEQDLSPIINIGYEHKLVLIYEDVDHIDAAGFDPRSIIRARTVNVTSITIYQP